MNRFDLAWKALWQLGPGPVGLNALYRLGLRSGLWRRKTPPESGLPGWKGGFPPAGFRRLPDLDSLRSNLRQFFEAYPLAAGQLVAEADEICAGQVRLFGAEPVPLQLDPGAALEHWTVYEQGLLKPGPNGDIKFVWEPARFGWVFSLARAFVFTGHDAYAQTFWEYTGQFLDANPTNLGPNWMSGQEVGLRLVALLFGLYVFAGSPQSTPDRGQRLLNAAVQHARRIPPTLIYARSQQNNHLITEALGLYTAGLVLEGHPEAAGWKKLGWKWLERGLLEQIAADGTYSQHSSNYHRLMLQTALWGGWLARLDGRAYAPAVQDRLALAARWLLDHVDRESGQASNLGNNDGASILPLAVSDFEDYRPAAQTANLAFLYQTPFAPGPWDEPAVWFGLQGSLKVRETPDRQKLPRASDRRLDSAHSWASLRAVHFSGRPAHADQLHVDLWGYGYNLALDAGTFRYTAAPPWDNNLARTLVHNTISVGGHDQMLRAGRFLWLDWAQVIWKDSPPGSLTAVLDGIQQQALVHVRRLSLAGPDTWTVEDHVEPAFKQKAQRTVTLNWLLPDWPHRVEGSRLCFTAPFGELIVSLDIDQRESEKRKVRLIREGKSLLDHQPADPLLGWYSPTYSVRKPALSFQMVYQGLLPVTFTTKFYLAGLE